MMVMMSVLESALTVSPTAMPTETTVPVIGLVRVASLSDCWALVRSASAVSMAAWSEAICSGVSVSAPDDARAGRRPCRRRRCRSTPVPVAGGPPCRWSPVPVLPCRRCRAWLPWVGAGARWWSRSSANVPPEDSASSAWASAVSSFDTVVWSFDTCCSSVETVWSAASHVAWPVVVLVLALVQSLWAWARSAASLLLVGGQRRLVLRSASSGLR